MFEKIRKMKNQKGFTLVELIVVLVILAILAAMLVPALTGYIDKANNEKIIATTRQVVMAAQTEISEAYSKATLKDGALTIEGGEPYAALTNDKNIDGVKIIELAEVGTKDADGKYKLNNGITKIEITYELTNGHVKTLKLTQGSKLCTYTEGAENNYEVGKAPATEGA